MNGELDADGGARGLTSHQDRYSVCVLFPDDRAAALGAPGFREVVRWFDADDRFLTDWAWYDKRGGTVTVERGTVRGHYDCVAVSVPYEPLYESAARALEMLGIPPRRTTRTATHPLILMGGAAPTLNPAVAGVFADVIHSGEIEPLQADSLIAALDNRTTRAVPRLLTPMTGASALEKPGAALRFCTESSRIDSSFHSRFDTPHDTMFEGAGLVEVGRGCPRGCRFCAAGHIYLPARFRTMADILGDVATYRGYADRIGLVGAAVSDHPDLDHIIRAVIDAGFGVTTSSFRADMLDDGLASLLVRGGMKTVTVAPEGGSDRMRRIMNKHLMQEAVLEAAAVCARAGFTRMKLYFIVGMPWETPADIDAICSLTQKVKKVFSAHMTVSVNPFIPKPQTPFQWCPMAGSKYLEDIYRSLGRSMRAIGVTLNTFSVRAAVREAVLTLGDERVGAAVCDGVENGTPWKKALRDRGIDVAELVNEEKPEDHVFPWDMLMTPAQKKALYASNRSAYSAAHSIT